MQYNRLKSALKRVRRNESGNATLILGLVAVPLIAITGLAVDMARISEARSSIQQVADGAALAAAEATGTDTQREEVGRSFAAHNMPDLHGVTATPAVHVDGDNVTVSIATVVDATLLAVAFPVKGESLEADQHHHHQVELPSVSFSISAGAYAKPGEEGDYCLLALNTTMDNAIYIRGTGDFTAADCHVHSNSASSQSSIHLQGNADAIADGFTAVGGWSQTGGAGAFSEPPVGGRAEIADPIALDVTDPGGTAATATIKKQNGNVSLGAAKYANITIQAQGEATFTSGVHYITGTLSIGSQGVLNGMLHLCYSAATPKSTWDQAPL